MNEGQNPISSGTGTELKKAEIISNGNVNLNPTKIKLWAVFDAGGQGMKDNGLIGVFTSEKAAKDFVGTKWLSIKPFISDTPYPEGVQHGAL